MSDLTKKIKTALTEAFNAAAEKRVENGQHIAYGVPGLYSFGLPLRDFCQPPVVFEKRHNMTGLSCQYFLPPDLSPRELQEYGMITREDMRRDERLREVWDHLKTCNPDTLGQLSFNEDDGIQLYHAILGAASAFLPEDIQSWLDGKTGTVVKKDRKMNLLINKIEICCGNIGWVPCLSTLLSIDRQMNEKRVFPARHAPRPWQSTSSPKKRRPE